MACDATLIDNDATVMQVLQDCPMCNVELKQLSEIAAFKCGHTGCKACMLKVVDTSKKCHMCRTVVSTVVNLF
jgi:hypothetical protein